MSKKPIIGITLDAEEIGGFSKWYPWYALRKNYSEAVVKAGGIPLHLPHHPEFAEQYISLIDGLIVTGGDFDIDPKLYGAKEIHPKVTTKPGRTDFEMAITKFALEKKMPILGICGGEQLINVILGGTLIQHIPDVTGTAIHQMPADQNRNLPAHSIAIEKGSQFAGIIGGVSMQVNSTHHQAIDKPGEGIVISAKAPDGIIEAIESKNHPFCIGVQWHPEYHADPDGKDIRIFEALIKASTK